MQHANDNRAPANAGALRFLSVCSGIEAAWAVPLFNWLGARIQSHMPPIAANDNTKDIASAAA